MKRPVLGKHSCARGKPECPVCRYGFPLDLVGRDGRRLVRLDKGDKLVSWFPWFSQDDRLCCNHGAHIVFGNLKTIGWRPCVNLWAVCEYVTKYATKAPTGSKRLGEVLRTPVDEVCKYEPENEGADLLRKSVQGVFAKTLGDRDHGIFEAAHAGLRMLLVLLLLDCVSLSTAGARVLRTKNQTQEGSDNEAVTYESKVDIFDHRYDRVREKQPGNCKITQDDVVDIPCMGFGWSFGKFTASFLRKVQQASACSP